MKIITIIGYWNDTGLPLERECAIGQYDGESNDDHIFYWFDDESSIHGNQGDFIVDYYIDENGNYSKFPSDCPECKCVQTNPNYKDFTNQTVHVCEQCNSQFNLIY